MTFDEFKSAYEEFSNSHGFDGKVINNEITVIFPQPIKNMGKITDTVRFGMINFVKDHDYSTAFNQIKDHFIKYIPQMEAGNIERKI